jgi:hypothetical protein
MDNCGMNFPTKASLRYHLLKHEGQREYQCNFPGCEKKFLTLSQLKQHENSSSVHKNLRGGVQNNYLSPEYYPEEPAVTKRQHVEESEYEHPNWEETLTFDSPKIEEKVGKSQDLEQFMRENEALKRKLEESQKLITILQQKASIDPFSYMDSFSGPNYFVETNAPLMNTDVFFGLDD